MTMFEKLKLLFWWKRSTKIVLWSAESIGVSGGYVSCKREISDANNMLRKEQKTLSLDAALKNYVQRMEEIERKYFGPKYVRK